MAVMDKRKPFSHLSVQELEARLVEAPGTTLCVACGVSFFAGVLAGSRLARALALVGVGYGAAKLVGAGKPIDPALLTNRLIDRLTARPGEPAAAAAHGA